MLDKAGFANAKIVCSGDLDEFMIADLKQRGAKIDVWGVGTKLTTGQPDARSGGIYKLGAVPASRWGMAIPHQTFRRISEGFGPRLIAGPPVLSAGRQIHGGRDLRN